MRRVLRLHQKFPTSFSQYLRRSWYPPLGKASKISFKQIPDFSSPTIYPKLPCRLLNITFKSKLTSKFPSLGWYEKSFEALSVVSNSLHNIWEVMIPPIALGKSSKISLKQISDFSLSTIYPKLPCRLLIITLLNGSIKKHPNSQARVDMRRVLRVHQ